MPIPVTFETPELTSNESLKTFQDTDSLGKAYLELDTRVKGGGIDLLPKELASDPAITPFKTMTDLAKGYVETKKMVGGIEKAPEKPDGYKFTPMTGLHPNLKADNIVTALRPMLHTAGLGNKQADIVQQGLLTQLSGLMAKQEQDRKDLALKNETALRTEWGADYEAKFDKIVKTMQLVGGKEMSNETAAIAAAMKGSPNFLKGMGKLIGLLSEDSLKSLGEGAEKPITDATAAKAEIDKYNAEITAQGTKHPYWNDKDPKHGEAVKKMHDLFALMQTK